MIGSARVARKTSPDLFVLLLRASIKVTFSGVPSGIWKTALTLGRSASRFPAFGAFGFAGVAGAAVLTDEVALSCNGWSGWTELAAASSVDPLEHPPSVKIRVTIKKIDKNGFMDPSVICSSSQSRVVQSAGVVSSAKRLRRPDHPFPPSLRVAQPPLLCEERIRASKGHTISNRCLANRCNRCIVSLLLSGRARGPV